MLSRQGAHTIPEFTQTMAAIDLLVTLTEPLRMFSIKDILILHIDYKIIESYDLSGALTWYS